MDIAKSQSRMVITQLKQQKSLVGKSLGLRGIMNFSAYTSLSPPIKGIFIFLKVNAFISLFNVKTYWVLILKIIYIHIYICIQKHVG